MNADDLRVTGTIGDSIQQLLEENSAETREYLKERLLTSAALGLGAHRKAAGITQADLAERLGTKQPAISALEGDLSGSFSFRRYVDYLLACNVLPLDLSFAPVEGVRQFLLTNFNESPTATAYATWFAAQTMASGLRATVQTTTTQETDSPSWQDQALRILKESGNTRHRRTQPEYYIQGESVA